MYVFRANFFMGNPRSKLIQNSLHHSRTLCHEAPSDCGLTLLRPHSDECFDFRKQNPCREVFHTHGFSRQSNTRPEDRYHRPERYGVRDEGWKLGAWTPLPSWKRIESLRAKTGTTYRTIWSICPLSIEWSATPPTCLHWEDFSVLVEPARYLFNRAKVTTACSTGTIYSSRGKNNEGIEPAVKCTKNY